MRRSSGPVLRRRAGGAPTSTTRRPTLGPSRDRGDLGAALGETNVIEVLDELDRELIALAPVKTRIREIAALLLIDRLRERGRPRLRPPVAAHVVHRQPRDRQDDGRDEDGGDPAPARLHREADASSPVTRDDLVGQYVGHTAPKTKEVLRRAYGGVLFIDEAYYLYRPENERDYGGEAIEILLQVMETERDNLVVIFAGYKDRMDDFFRSNPGLSVTRRPPHRLPRLRRRRADGDRPPDARAPELRASARAPRRPSAPTSSAASTRPRFAHGRSVRNSIDRARLRQANRLFADGTGVLTRES